MNDKIKVLIVEDEETWVLSLQTLLDSMGFEVVAVASTLADAINNINNTEFDIALLDIHIDDTNSGISLGQLIKTSFKKPFVFITASSESHTLLEAAKAKPSAYLIKPADRNSLYIAIQNAIENFIEKSDPIAIEQNLNQESFFIKIGKKYMKVFWQDVLSLRSEQKYTALELMNDSTECYIRSSLQNTIKHLVPPSIVRQYVQINRAEYINMKFVEELLGNTLKTSNKKTFAVSDNYLPDLKTAMNIMH
ncbi:MAG: response regulator [Chitinophagaceae bacterium]|jgi:DNA-binding LytR/AlgR family response regulator|nr:response regulator [Chitinophagaceae bacterium]MBP9739190.1 response regulator [Chitinophagaceae bacterium]